MVTRVLVRALTAWGFLSAGIACQQSGGSRDPAPDSLESPTDEVSSEVTGGEVSDVAVAPDQAEADVDVRPPAICRPGSRWKSGDTAFEDVTAASGLTALGVAGIRLSSADIDGDGDPDLVTRQHVIGVRDDLVAGSVRYTWVLRNDAGVFSDVTAASGFLTPRSGEGGRSAQVVVFGDVNNDGYLDAFSGVNPGTDAAKDNGDRTEILLGDGKGGFVLAEGGDVREEGKLWSLNAASFTDANLDGNLDVFAAYGTDAAGYPLPDRLYTGDGKGTFTDVTEAFGFTFESLGDQLSDLNAGNTDRNSWGALAADLNDDGAPDFVTASYGRALNGLWLSNGKGEWTNPGYASGVPADLNEDWGSNLNAECYCKLTPAAEGCEPVPDPPGFFGCDSVDGLRWNHEYDRERFRLGGNTFTHAVGDLDGDGDLDLVEADIQHWDVGASSDPSQILINDGSGTFTRPQILSAEHAELDWNDGDMTAAIFDFDNDGRADIYIGSSDYPGTRGRLYHQAESGVFEAVAPDVGIDHARSQGLTVADFDSDGDLDVAVGHGTARCSGDPSCYPTAEVHLFQNQTPAGNAIRIRLVGGPGSNRSAIGARVRVTAGGRTFTQELGGGYGHYGLQNDLVLHFGLGEACEIDSIEVRWPDIRASVDTWDNVRANYTVLLTQGGAIEYEAGE